MDIRQLKYFIEIVNSNFNLSAASIRLSISQPALSMLIKKFEKDENTKIFMRNRGSIIGLTSVGENFYNHALRVVDAYEQMYGDLRRSTAALNGHMRIGIPQLVVTVLCTEFLGSLVARYNKATFTVDEAGAHDLKKKLMLGEIDSAFLLGPTGLDPQNFHETEVEHDELLVYMSREHPLAGKEKLKWRDLSGYSLVTFDSTYMIHHKTLQKLKTHRVNARIAMMSKSWDFLLESVRHSNHITMLPAPISQFYNLQDMREMKIDDPILWQVMYTYPVKSYYSRIEKVTHKEVADYFIHRETPGKASKNP